MGTGLAVNTGDAITAAKMNSKLEAIVDADLTHGSGSWTIGEDGAGQDVIYYTDESGRVITWDPSDSQLEFDDNVLLAFGDDDDVTIKWNGSNLEILPLTDDAGKVCIGDGTTDMDFKWFGGTAAKYVQFDVGEAKVILDDVDLAFGDNDILIFGDGADVTFTWNGSKLVVTAAVPATGTAFELKTTVASPGVSDGHSMYIDLTYSGTVAGLSRNVGIWTNLATGAVWSGYAHFVLDVGFYHGADDMAGDLYLLNLDFECDASSTPGTVAMIRTNCNTAEPPDYFILFENDESGAIVRSDPGTTFFAYIKVKGNEDNKTYAIPLVDIT